MFLQCPRLSQIVMYAKYTQLYCYFQLFVYLTYTLIRSDAQNCSVHKLHLFFLHTSCLICLFFTVTVEGTLLGAKLFIVMIVITVFYFHTFCVIGLQLRWEIIFLSSCITSHILYDLASFIMKYIHFFFRFYNNKAVQCGEKYAMVAFL